MDRKAVAAQIKGPSVKVYDQRGGNLFNVSAPHAKSAVASGDSVAITFERGNTKIYDSRGRLRANLNK